MKATEITILYELISRLTGSNQDGSARRDNLMLNIKRIMRAYKCKNLAQYLDLVDRDPRCHAEFISAITIHTTSWFREAEHFDIIEQHVLELLKLGRKEITFWSSACSTGQEVYTLALCLENLRERHPELEYAIVGTDIDPVSVAQAERAVFPVTELIDIPPRYRSHVWVGSGRADGLFTLSKRIRERCHFGVFNLDSDATDPWSTTTLHKLDVVLCRNVLIYFSGRKYSQIVERLKKRLSANGLLVLGHSEPVLSAQLGFRALGRACYQAIPEKNAQLLQEASERSVLIVDDLPVIRTLLKSMLKREGFQTYEAASVFEAEKILASHKIDLISLDLNMPEKNGADWLRELRARGVSTPVVIVSASSVQDAEAVYGALSVGAQDYFEKENLRNRSEYYLNTVKSLTQPTESVLPREVFLPRNVPENLLKKYPSVVLIGASTGGPEAIWQLLRDFPLPCPPIVIVQHTSPFYAKCFAQTVEKASKLGLSPARDGEVLQANTLYIAQGDYHLRLEARGADIVLRQDTKRAQIFGFRPAIDVLFRSAALLPHSKLALLLTGMGEDGAQAMKELAEQELCYNMAQSENSCVVYGMPRIAKSLNAVHYSGDIPSLRKKLLELLKLSDAANSGDPLARAS